jgi:hypothetical protein
VNTTTLQSAPLAYLRDALARVVWIREEFDAVVREQALEDLEHDLAAELAELKGRAA